PTGNPQFLFAAFGGDAVYLTPTRGATWSKMNGGIGDPLLRDVTDSTPTAVLVTPPADTPNGAKGRISLAAPALTGNVLQDTQYQGWLYALVATASGALDGVYMTKDFGQNWVKLRVAATSATSGIPTNDINNSDIPVLGGVGGFAAQGNYDMAIAVDPQNPNVIYVGGTLDGPPTGLIRVDTTFVHDA